MNMHGIVSAAIGTVNPFVTVVISYSNGALVTDSGRRDPQFINVPVTAQIQALTFKDLQQLEGLNLNGERRAIYLYGVSHAVARALQKGGDVITDSDGNEWLVAQVIEQWADGYSPAWVKVAVTLQNRSVNAQQ